MTDEFRHLMSQQKQIMKIINKELATHDKLKKLIASDKATFPKIEKACRALIESQQSLSIAMAILDMIERQLPKRYRTK